MRPTILLIQSLALFVGTLAALEPESQAQQRSQTFLTQKFPRSMKVLTEAEVFNKPAHPEVTTPEQKAAAEMKAKEIESLRATQPEKKNRHPDLVLHKNGPLTKSEQEHLTHARSAAIEDSKVHQVHADESKCSDVS
jgi:hypothetical protein